MSFKVSDIKVDHGFKGAKQVAHEAPVSERLSAQLHAGNMTAAADTLNALQTKGGGFQAHADHNGLLTIMDASGKAPLMSIQKDEYGSGLHIVAPIENASGDAEFKKATLSDPADRLAVSQAVATMAQSSRLISPIMIAAQIEDRGLQQKFKDAAPQGPATTWHVQMAAAKPPART